MAETHEGLQQTREEVNIDQIIKFLQSFDVLLTENRDILSVLPEFIKKLGANITKVNGTATYDGTREVSGPTEEQESKKKKWETKQKRQDKQDPTEKNQYKSKCLDLKAKLRTTNAELQAKQEKIADLGEELRAKQEDYEKETQRSGKELAEKEEELAKVMKQLHTIKQQHDESLRSQETKIDELQARIVQLEGERRSLQEDFEKEKERRNQELNEKENALRKEKIERERVKQHYTDNLRDKETKLKRSEACNEELTRENEEWRKSNENLITEIENKKDELRHYAERFNHQEEQHKSDLSLKEMEVNKLKERLSHSQKEVKRLNDELGQFKSRLSRSQKEVKRLNDELGQFKSRFAGICEKRVKQDQRKVENILASNQQSEVEKDFKEFFDSSREDARDIIQSLYGSEEEIDVHVYYPRIACTILETAYEHVNDVKEAVVDLFKVATQNLVLRAPEEGYNFRLKRTEGSFDYVPIPADDLNTSEKSTDVLDALLISLKETAHSCSLECLEKDVTESSWKKWTEWFDKDETFVHAPSQAVLLKLDSYIKDCIRLTWRMVTQLPPLRLEYHSPRFDHHIHKKTTFQNSTEKNQSNEESLELVEDILCYLWPGLLDGGGRLILQGQVLCKMQRENLK